ncbi:CHAPERONE-LIKE PROTEIN [Drosera capensis]
MSVSGVAGCPSGYCLRFRGRSLGGQGARLMSIRVPSWSQNQQQLRGSCLIRGLKQFNPRHGIRISCSAGASYGDAFNDSAAVFPRLNVGDPYKRLGISREASEQEIYAARNFLIQRYGGHEPSKKAIESAHDKIIRQKLNERRRPKLNLDKKVRDMMQNKYVKMVLGRFRTPSSKFIFLTAAAFVVLGVITVLYPTYDGPTFQVGVSLFATMYFIHSRLKSKARAVLYGIGAFILSWLVGTFLMVSVIPPILKGPRDFEVATSLITYVLLWVSSTYLI